jgi:hypothetical protein
MFNLQLSARELAVKDFPERPEILKKSSAGTKSVPELAANWISVFDATNAKRSGRGE